jgi:trk system potassium uptake protein TrkA
LVTQAVVADATEESVLRSLGLADVDVAIVSIGENLEASVLITLLLQEIGVKSIVVKAVSVLHARVLAKVGADRVVFPERDMAEKLVEGLVSPNILDEIKVSQDYNLMEIIAPKSFVGKSLGEIGPRARYRVTIVAIRRKVPYLTEEGDSDFREETNISPEASDEINEGDILVVVGRYDDLDKLKEL